MIVHKYWNTVHYHHSYHHLQRTNQLLLREPSSHIDENGSIVLNVQRVSLALLYLGSKNYQQTMLQHFNIVGSVDTFIIRIVGILKACDHIITRRLQALSKNSYTQPASSDLHLCLVSLVNLILASQALLSGAI